MGQFAKSILIDIGNTQSDRIWLSRSEAAFKISRSPRQLAYYHKLLATNSDSYKFLLIRRIGQSKPKFNPHKIQGEKANGLLYCFIEGKLKPGFCVDLKKPLREQQIIVLRRVRDLFARRMNEQEVIEWIRANDDLIHKDLRGLIDELATEFRR